MSHSLYTNPIILNADPNQAAFWYKRIVPEMGKKMSWIRSKERVRGIVASHSAKRKMSWVESKERVHGIVASHSNQI